MTRIKCFREFREPLYRQKEFLGNDAPAKGETAIESGWKIVLPDSPSLQVRIAAGDLKRFLLRGAGKKLSVVENASATGGCILLQRSRRVMQPESFTLISTPECISIESADDSGIMYGIFYIEEMMRFRNAPVLQCGRLTRTPAIKTRIFRSPMAFYYPEQFDRLDSSYPDGYLLKLAHHGFNGIWLRVNLRDIVTLDEFPEFGTDADSLQQAIRHLAERCGVYGIKVYLFFMEPLGLPPDHPVFKRLPHIKGEYFEPEQSCALCSSTSEVKHYLQNGFKSLFKAIPTLGGAILISASEHHSHCWSHTGTVAEHGIDGVPDHGNISCPRCRNRSPQDVIAEIITLINKGIKSVCPEANVIAWNWSWSLYEQDPQKNLIGKLPKDIILMADFERGGNRITNGHSHVVDEYSLCYIGPSERFKGSARAAKAAGMEVYAKLQIGTTHELATVPYLPLPFHVAEKFLQLIRNRGTGSMECWNFGNMLSMNTELANWFSWKPLPESPEMLLHRIAVRDFGPEAADAFVHAWKQFSRAAAFYPIFMDFLYWSPANRGCAYPLLFKKENRPLPSSWLLPEEVQYNFSHKDLFRTGFGDDLSNICHHITPSQTVATLKKFCAVWRKGVDMMEEILPSIPDGLRSNAEKAHAVAASVLCQLRSTCHFIEFTDLRNSLPERDGTKRWRGMVRLRGIAEAELANSIEGRRLAAMDNSLGFHGEAFGYLYTPAKIDRKIRHLRKLLCSELADS